VYVLSDKRENKKVVSITNIAKAFGITPRTLRHWEDIGLLLPERNGAASIKVRYYDAYDISVISSIIALSSSGVELQDIKQLLKYADISDEKLGEYKEKLSSLSQAANIISTYIPQYANNYSIEEYTLHSQFVVVKSKWVNGINEAYQFYYEALVECINAGYEITPNYSIFCQYPLNTRNGDQLHFERDYFLMRFFMPVRHKFNGTMPEDRFIPNEIFRERPIEDFKGVQTDFVYATGCHAISTVHFGSAVSTDRAYKKLYDYMDKSGYKQRGLVHEIYLNKPISGVNSSKMISRIVLPVEPKIN
jgi:DNA-binding transcriptional MerR regulator